MMIMSLLKQRIRAYLKASSSERELSLEIELWGRRLIEVGVRGTNVNCVKYFVSKISLSFLITA